MTAINVAVSPDGRTGYMLADTAEYDLNGTITGVVDKVARFPSAEMMCAVRGEVVDCKTVTALIGAFNSFDAAMENAPGALRIAKRFITSGISFEIVIVGWSAQRGRIAAAFASSDNAFSFGVADIILAPLLDESALAEIGITGKLKAPRDLLKIMQAQRNMIEGEPRDEHGFKHVVGGAAVLTTLTRNKIEQHVVHRWPAAGKNPDARRKQISKLIESRDPSRS